MSVLILTHGNLAGELLDAAKMIAGDLPDFEALALDWQDSPEAARAKVADRLDAMDRSHGVLILTDIFGATPCNTALSFLEPGKVEVLSGVNLPMVVRLGCLYGKASDAAELGSWLKEKGRQSICLASEKARPPARGAPDPCADGET